MITPNISELETLAERKLENRNDLPTVCAALRERFRHLLVTLGAEGVYHYNASEQQGQYYTALPTRVLDANGAGDAFVAGFVSGIVHEYQIDRCIRLGIAAAHFTLQSVDTVNNELTFEHCLTLTELTHTPLYPPVSGGKSVTLFCELPPVYGGMRGGLRKI
jgi:pseudouridine kinase